MDTISVGIREFVGVQSRDHPERQTGSQHRLPFIAGEDSPFHECVAEHGKLLRCHRRKDLVNHGIEIVPACGGIAATLRRELVRRQARRHEPDRSRFRCPADRTQLLEFMFEIEPVAALGLGGGRAILRHRGGALVNVRHECVLRRRTSGMYGRGNSAT